MQSRATTPSRCLQRQCQRSSLALTCTREYGTTLLPSRGPRVPFRKRDELRSVDHLTSSFVLQRWLHCAAYLALQSAFLLALLVRDAAAQSLPAERPVSVQHESSSAVSKREWSALLGLAILTCGTFLLLQGSDPGYLNEGELVV